MLDRGPFIFRATGPPGALGCGLALVFLGLFLLTPVAVFLIKGIGWGVDCNRYSVVRAGALGMVLAARTLIGVSEWPSHGELVEP